MEFKEVKPEENSILFAEQIYINYSQNLTLDILHRNQLLKSEIDSYVLIFVVTLFPKHYCTNLEFWVAWRLLAFAVIIVTIMEKVLQLYIFTWKFSKTWNFQYTIPIQMWLWWLSFKIWSVHRNWLYCMVYSGTWKYCTRGKSHNFQSSSNRENSTSIKIRFP